ncbi:hypothetical protein BH23CHL5_BH23CHL5_24810 [soil metagenome]
MIAHRQLTCRTSRFSRRTLMFGVAATPMFCRMDVAGQTEPPTFGLPIGLPGRIPGDGRFILHGYACENTGFNSGWWHTGENWYTLEGNSAGALVYAIADGEVMYVDADYPGRVVILRHGPELYSMYGHLDFDVPVDVGQIVERGQTLGTVLFRTDSRSPSHLHFEVRTFLITPIVNGPNPRYGFACGPQCPPGPGYWPMNDPDHPSELGWLNPMHVIAGRALAKQDDRQVEVVVASGTGVYSTEVWAQPIDDHGSQLVERFALIPGTRYPLIRVITGNEATTGTSATSYQVWYEIELSGALRGWVKGAVQSNAAIGEGGRPSAIVLPFLIASIDESRIRE